METQHRDRYQHSYDRMSFGSREAKQINVSSFFSVCVSLFFVLIDRSTLYLLKLLLVGCILRILVNFFMINYFALQISC